jgi:hypothetical protein
VLFQESLSLYDFYTISATNVHHPCIVAVSKIFISVNWGLAEGPKQVINE